MLLRKRLTVVLATALMLTMSAAPAFAHHCTNANKKLGAGSMGTYNVVTESFTPSKSGGGAFVTFTDGSTFSYDIYQHRTLPAGALEAGPGGDDRCDGRGIDDALACLGITE